MNDLVIAGYIALTGWSPILNIQSTSQCAVMTGEEAIYHPWGSGAHGDGQERPNHAKDSPFINLSFSCE
jgi:hypothetical protein